jgi:hypothetical protein
MSAASDPCFRCTLPDCDEHDQRCEVRRIYRQYCNKVRSKRHDEVTAEERLAHNRIFQAWHLDRAAEASEGGRPYRRGTTIYGSGEAGR